jgi:hypothetical protein
MLANAGVGSRAVVVELNSVAVPSLDVLEEVLSRLPDGSRVPLRYKLPQAQHQERVAVVTIDRTWFAAVRYDCDEVSGCWRARKLPPPPPPPPPTPQPVSFTLGGPEEVQVVTPALVRVLFDIPYQVDGVAGLKWVGAGIVVDAAHGLVLVDRNTVPVALGDVHVEFACTVEVKAEVIFLHPTHNFSLVRYNPQQVTGDIATAELSAVPLEVGDEVMFVGLSKDNAALPVYQQCVVRETTVMEVVPTLGRCSRGVVWQRKRMHGHERQCAQ